MLIHSATKADFAADVRQNVIEARIERAFRQALGHRTSAQEVQSWANSMMYMHNIIDDEAIPHDAGVAIEYRIPQTAKRIDFLLTGADADDRDTVVIVELKQWTEVEATPKDAIVKTWLGGAHREVTHPSYQAWIYQSLLEDFNEAVSQDAIRLQACAYLHNCQAHDALHDPRYKPYTDRAPVFLRRDAERLTEFIKRHVRRGDRRDLLYRIERGKIRPSKCLADSLARMLQGNEEFRMIDDQKVVYETALHLAQRASARGGQKQVLLVPGGPGTGKSVVDVNLLVELTRRGSLVHYVTKNAAPRAVYESKLTGTLKKTRIKTHPEARAKQDSSLKGYKTELKRDRAAAERQAAAIVKNTYRTLMTRGQQGCYVWSTDPETNLWFRQAFVGATAEAERPPYGRLPACRERIPPPATQSSSPTASSSRQPPSPARGRYPGLTLPILTPAAARRSGNAAPIFDVVALAGAFSEEQEADESGAGDWVELPPEFRVTAGMFVVRVEGESMNRRIASGSWCLFKRAGAGTREGKIVLARHRELTDAEHGGHYTVKQYHRVRPEESRSQRGESKIQLRPLSTDPTHQPLVFDAKDADTLTILAELVAVL